MNDAAPPRTLTPPERLILWLMRESDRLVTGVPNPFVEELVRRSGFRAILTFLVVATKVSRSLDKRYGLVLSNVVTGFVGMWNGCRHCGVGHIYAANLVHFDETGELYPIAEVDVPLLEEMTYEASMARVRELLAGEAFAEHLRVLERLYALRSGAEPRGEEDRLLALALACWAWMNDCSVPVTYDMQVKVVPAIMDKRRRARVVDRYRAKRDGR